MKSSGSLTQETSFSHHENQCPDGCRHLGGQVSTDSGKGDGLALLTVRRNDENLLVENENLILQSERRTPVRLAPLPAEQWDDDVLRALSVMLPEERLNPAGAGTALSTLVRHPSLTKAFLRFSTHLLFRSTLDARVRELAILRVAYRRGCEYEWSHHVFMGKAEGLTDDDIAGVERGRAADPFDQAVLDAVDELLEVRSQISDQTWARLSERLSERQLMDLVFTVGGYGLMAMAYNTFGVKPESGQEDGSKESR